MTRDELHLLVRGLGELLEPPQHASSHRAAIEALGARLRALEAALETEATLESEVPPTLRHAQDESRP